MKKRVWVLNGQVIHVGEDWPHDIRKEARPVEGEPEALAEIAVDNNPVPIGAELIEAEIVVSDRGRIALATDYHALRADAYPAVGDQLDALWKGGEAAEAMLAQILSIKARYPKS